MVALHIIVHTQNHESESNLHDGNVWTLMSGV